LHSCGWQGSVRSIPPRLRPPINAYNLLIKGHPEITNHTERSVQQDPSTQKRHDVGELDRPPREYTLKHNRNPLSSAFLRTNIGNYVVDAEVSKNEVRNCYQRARRYDGKSNSDSATGRLYAIARNVREDVAGREVIVPDVDFAGRGFSLIEKK
jgi:hypothetical protein